MEKLNCEQAKQLDLIEYLAFLGHQPQKVRNGDYFSTASARYRTVNGEGKKVIY